MRAAWWVRAVRRGNRDDKPDYSPPDLIADEVVFVDAIVPLLRRAYEDGEGIAIDIRRAH
jgi:hypothetical protein